MVEYFHSMKCIFSPRYVITNIGSDLLHCSCFCVDVLYYVLPVVLFPFSPLHIAMLVYIVIRLLGSRRLSCFLLIIVLISRALQNIKDSD